MVLSLRYFNDVVSIAVGLFVLVMFVVMFGNIIYTNRTMKMWSEQENPDWSVIRRRSRRMLIVTGLWMIAVGLLLIVMGNWTNSIGVIGMGLLIIAGAWWNVFTGLDQSRRRPTPPRHRDD